MRNPTTNTGVRILGAALVTLLVLVVLAASARAQDGPSLRPTCGSEGDPVCLKGSSFGESPEVRFDGVTAEILKSSEDRILCLVPADTSLGPVKVTVDGTEANEEFTVLADGSPVVLWISAETVTPGMRVFLVGRRLGGGTVEFVHPSDGVQATADLRGGRRASMLTIPSGLAPGVYTLKVTNKDELDTGECSPEIEVVNEGAAALTSITPEAQLPGRKVSIAGTDLSPGGPCLVEWRDASGDTLRAFGFSNGYDRVVSRVPFLAEQGATYEVSVDLRGSTQAVGAIEYAVGTSGDPEITELEPDSGPAGSLFRILGKGLLVFGDKPSVEMTKGGETLTAKILYAMPGFHDRDEALLARVPADAEDGAYDVVVKVGDRTSAAATFTVGPNPLAVDSMRPNRQGKRGPFAPVSIRGTGFGSKKGDPIDVTWDDGSGGTPVKGKVLFRMDRLLVAWPPGGWKNPLAQGTYEVRVVLDPDGQAVSVSAGTYTVK